MPKASIVYWYDGSKMRLDGGGLRIQAWDRALRALGYETEVHGLWTIGGGVAKGSHLSAIKRTLIPLPMARPLPASAADADLVVATVPAVFNDARRRVAPRKLILDWMDLWSLNARTVGDANALSRIGGRLQSQIWRRRERSLTGGAHGNTYAGWNDCDSMTPIHHGLGRWIPTPVARRPLNRAARPIRKLGFIANLDYPPNRISLREFLARRHGDLERRGIEMLVAGYGSAVVAEWGFPVTVVGETEHVADFYADVDAVVVPINHGGGIKVKAVEALSYGVPVFATDHVRAGFSREFWRYLPDVSELSHHTVPRSVPRELFESVFSPEEFTARVATVVSEVRSGK